MIMKRNIYINRKEEKKPSVLEKLFGNWQGKRHRMKMRRMHRASSAKLTL